MSWFCTLPRRECVRLAMSVSLEACLESGLEEGGSGLGCAVVLEGNDDRPLIGVAGVAGVLPSGTETCVDNREGTLDPPLPVLLMG